MVNYAPLLNAPDIGQQFAQGVQQGRETRLMGQRDSALQALSANPNDPNAINALMAVDPRTAMAFEERGARQAEQQQAAQRNAAFGQALGGLEGLPEPVRQLAAGGDAQGAMQLWQVVQQADAAQLKQIDEMRQRNGQLLIALQGVPEAQRAAMAQQLAPQYGVQSIQGLDFSDAGIQRSLTEAVGIGEMLKIETQRRGQDITMRGQDIQVRGQDISAANAAAARSVQIRGQNMARENAMISAGSVKPPAGYRWNARGELEGIPGGPADPSKMKLTGEQAKSAGQLALARQAEKTIGQFKGVPSEAALVAYGTPVLERAVDAPTRRVLGAQMAFTEAALRFSTGAAYTETEIKNNVRMYFPRPGDTPEAIRDKAALRQQMIQAMELGAGPAAPRVRTQPTTPARSAPAKTQGFSIRRID